MNSTWKFLMFIHSSIDALLKFCIFSAMSVLSYYKEDLVFSDLKFIINLCVKN
jgi:hypothetical protein